MSEKQQKSSTLNYEVHMVKRPGLARGLPPGTESLQWVVNTATLIYGETHPYLGETSEQSRLNWITAIENIAALNPRAVVVGHRKPEDGENPQYLEATRKYIQDFNRLNHETKTARELYDKMLSLYPDRSNPGSLWGAANAAKTQ